MRFKTIFLFLSLVAWTGSSYICDSFFPTTSSEDINGYWELKKIIYSICIILIVLSAEYNTKIKKFISLIFIGILSEDISDRIQGITYFEYSDIIVLDLVILSSIYIIYPNVYNKIFNHNLFRRNRR